MNAYRFSIILLVFSLLCLGCGICLLMCPTTQAEVTGGITAMLLHVILAFISAEIGFPGDNDDNTPIT